MSHRDTNPPLPHIAVLDAQCVHFSDGTQRPRRRPFASLGELASAARQLGLEQLWCTADALPADFRPDAPGWQMSSNNPQRPARAFWFSGWEPGTYGRVEIALCANDDKGIVRHVTNGAALLDALMLYREQVGVPFRWGAGSTGVRLIRALHTGPHSLTLDLPGTPPPPALVAGTEVPLDWQRPLSPDERSRRYLHSYDKNGQYLAAASSLPLGLGCAARNLLPGPVLGAVLAQENKDMPPGYWRVHVRWCPDLPASAHPLPLPYRLPRRGTLLWITTPTLLLLRELGCDTAVVEAWVWDEHHRALEPWYRRLRDARAFCQHTAAGLGESAAIALRAVKATYTQSLGYLSYKGANGRDRAAEDTLYRPDWRHAVIAQAKANQYRRIVQCARDGYYPFAVGADCLYIVSDEPDPVRACPPALRLEDTLAGWKVKDSGVPLAEALPIIEGNSPHYLHELQVWLNCRREGRVYEPEYEDEGVEA